MSTVTGPASALLSWISPMFPAAVATFLLFWVARKLSWAKRKLPYPPGPPPRDFVSGNARDLLGSHLWLMLTERADIYGPIMHLRCLNAHMIVINTVEDAIEIMEKRSNNYSSRPNIPMVDLMGWDFAIVLKPYGPEWKEHRRLMQQTFRPSAALKYRAIQIEKVTDMLNSLLETPEEFISHIKTLSASIIMSAMYGYKVSAKNDHFQELAEEAMIALSDLSLPGASIVNVLPFLRFLPSWFPGATFHRVGRRIASEVVAPMLEVPYKYVQDSMAAGTAFPSFVASRLEICKTDKERKLLKEIAASAYAAGADTTTSSIATFVYAMAMFPEVQKQAQNEIDRVVGNDRLVNFEDRDSLPYIQALVREVFRWRPVLPLAALHAAVSEDVYKGYYIPSGAAIIPNVWAMTRDATKYPNPEEFNPDRFFTADNKLNKDEVTYTFGFGRRICPGRHMASATVWLAAANILSVFDIRPPKDAAGNDIPLQVEYTGGFISHPVPFKNSIIPRSARTSRLIVDPKNSST